MGSLPDANARSRSTLAKQLRLYPISCVKKRLSGSTTKWSSPIFWRSSEPMAPGFTAILRFVTARARSWGPLSIITCEPIWSPMRLRRWLLRYLAAFGIAKRRKQYGVVQTHSLLLQKGFVPPCAELARPLTLACGTLCQRFQAGWSFTSPLLYAGGIGGKHKE